MERVRDASGSPKPAMPVTVTGCLFGVHSEDPATGAKPCLLSIEEQQVLAIFTTKEKLDACYAAAGMGPYKIKTVTEGTEFLSSVPWTVVLDPWITPDGNTRCFVIQRHGPRFVSFG